MQNKFMLNHLETSIIRSVLWFRKRGKVATAIWLLATLGLGVAASQLSINLDVSKFLTKGSEAARNYAEYQAKFGDSATFVQFFRKDALPLSAQDHCAILSWLAHARAYEPTILSSRSIYEMRGVVLREFRFGFPPLLTNPCSATGAKFDVSPIKRTPAYRVLVDAQLADSTVALKLKKLATEPYSEQSLNILTASLDRTFPNTGAISFRTFGAPVFLSLANAANLRDGMVNNLVALVFFVVFLCTFKSLTGACIAVGLILAARFWLFGILALSGQETDLVSAGLFLLTAVSVVQDYWFLAEKRCHVDSWEEAFTACSVPGFYTSLTTFCGFLSLHLSGIDILGRLGTLAAIGAVIQWILTFWMLPTLMQNVPRLRNFAAKGRPWFTASLNWRIPYPLAVASLALPIIGLGYIHKLPVEDGIYFFFPKEHRIHKDAHELLQSRGWQSVIHLVQKDRSAAEQNQLLTALEKHSDISLVRSAASWQAFALDYDKDNASAPDKVERYAQRMHGKAGQADLFLRKPSVASVLSIREFVRNHCQRGYCYTTGEMVAFAAFAGELSVALVRELYGSLALIIGVLVLLCWLRGFRGIGPMIIGSLWGPLSVLGILTIIQVPSNFVLCIYISVIVGFAGDNVIHFIYSTDGKDLGKVDPTIYAATIKLTIALLASTTVFYFSAFAPPRSLGIYLALGLVLNLVGDIWIVKSLVADRDKVNK